MKKTKFSILTIFIIGLNSCTQDLTCADFKTGEFYIPSEKNDVKKWIVVRESVTQTEWINGIGSGNPEYEILEWIDDCTYRLTYDENKMELDEQKNWINANNGIVVEKVRINGKCMENKATMTTNDGEKIEQNGKICAK